MQIIAASPLQMMKVKLPLVLRLPRSLRIEELRTAANDARACGRKGSAMRCKCQGRCAIHNNVNMTVHLAMIHEPRYSEILEKTSLWGLRLFLLLVSFLSLRNVVALFLDPQGWTHRVAGGALFLWLVCGAYLVPKVTNQSTWFLYDFTLGILGILATLTAARDFPHRHVKNSPGQSGTLERKAIVTQAEMVEHSFYQGLNLVQAMYLHCMQHFPWNSPYARLVALWLVTAPWLVRNRFPVHSFSNNWKHDNESSTEILLYQIKKWQYVFYKHAVFHGINISVALCRNKQQVLVTSPSWRIFWLALYTSYVMEFFLQSLVKRGMLTQNSMIWLQRLLMTASTCAALVAVMPHLHVGICVVSMVLNFWNRRHDVLNTMILAVIAMKLPLS